MLYLRFKFASWTNNRILSKVNPPMICLLAIFILHKKSWYYKTQHNLVSPICVVLIHSFLFFLVPIFTGSNDFCYERLIDLLSIVSKIKTRWAVKSQKWKQQNTRFWHWGILKYNTVRYPRISLYMVRYWVVFKN